MRETLIVQHRERSLRLFRQHDHGLLSGELALAWQEAGAWPEASDPLVLAASLHDLCWRATDEVPVWNGTTGRPYDFTDFPVARKFSQARRGIEELAPLHPYAAILVSLHYATFPGAPEGFRESEARRRQDLTRDLSDPVPDLGQVESDLALLRLFDVLSLHVCLTPPDADPLRRPTWLTGSYSLPGGGTLVTRWRGSDELGVDPFPFGSRPLRMEIPFRDLEGTRFDTGASLEEAWRRGETGISRVVLTPD